MTVLSRRLSLIFALIFATLCFSACSLDIIDFDNKGGSVKLSVAFVNVPEEFYWINENVRDDLSITVVIQNVRTNKDYIISLNNDNGYSYEAWLDPGTYRVRTVYTTKVALTGMVLQTAQEMVELTKGTDSYLPVEIANLQQFVDFQNNLESNSNIALMSRFSRCVMVDGNIVSMDDLPGALGFDAGFRIKAYSKKEIEDEARGIKIVLLNDTNEELAAQDCKVMSVEVSRNTVVFPGGVTLGMNADDICNASYGIYGTPSLFSGSALLGIPLSETKARYTNADNGDCLTLSVGKGGYVTKVLYEYEVYR